MIQLADVFRRVGGRLLFPLLLATGVGAQEAPRQWQFTLSPYFLAPNMSGTTALGETEVEVDADPGDIFDKLQFGAMLYFEAATSALAFSLDVIYMDLGQSVSNGELGVDQTAVMGSVYRRLSRPIELTLGLQMNAIGMTATGTGPLAPSFDGSDTWLDPFVGVRLSVPDSEKWRLALVGTVGGFGVGSDFIWQLYPQVGYRISRLLEVGIGYRVMSIDYSRGTGVEVFHYDVTTFGPQLGLAFHF